MELIKTSPGASLSTANSPLRFESAMEAEVCSLTSETIALFQSIAEPTVGRIGNHRNGRN